MKLELDSDKWNSSQDKRKVLLRNQNADEQEPWCYPTSRGPTRPDLIRSTEVLECIFVGSKYQERNVVEYQIERNPRTNSFRSSQVGRLHQRIPDQARSNEKKS